MKHYLSFIQKMLHYSSIEFDVWICHLLPSTSDVVWEHLDDQSFTSSPPVNITQLNKTKKVSWKFAPSFHYAAIVRFPPPPPFSCNSIISDRKIWRLTATQFHFWFIFGYELNTAYCSSKIYKKSFAIQVGGRQNVNKIVGTSWTLASKQHQIF